MIGPYGSPLQAGSVLCPDSGPGMTAAKLSLRLSNAAVSAPAIWCPFCNHKPIPDFLPRAREKAIIKPLG